MYNKTIFAKRRLTNIIVISFIVSFDIFKYDYYPINSDNITNLNDFLINDVSIWKFQNEVSFEINEKKLVISNIRK